MMNANDAPVRAVEQQVLRVAAGAQLDVAVDTDRARLRQIIAQCAADVNRTLTHQVPLELLVDTVARNLVGYGPLDALLSDPDVWEIMVNAPDEIFVKRHQNASGYHQDTFHDDAHVERTLTRLLSRAASNQRVLDPTQGLQDAQLDDGSRIHIVHPDLGRKQHYLVNIRRFTGVSYRSLQQLVDTGMLTGDAASWLTSAVASRRSMLIAGEPGAGKTTLLGCVAATIDPTLRVVTAEDVFELDIPHPNVAAMQTRPSRADQPAIELRRLVSGFLRMAPDVAIVGEIRDQEALPLLLALSSGVTGFATIHASHARQALTRLRLLAQLAPHAAQLDTANIDELVRSTVGVVVHVARHNNQPKVNEIVLVNADDAQPLLTPVFLRDANGVLKQVSDGA